MPKPRWLFWHRRDLRLFDNVGLSKAKSNTSAITGVFILDQKIFPKEDLKSIFPASQVWFLTKSLDELKRNWSKTGSDLLILHGNPIKLIPLLAEAINADCVCWNKDIEPENISIDKQIIYKLQKQSIKALSEWDQLLIAPNQIRTGNNNPYKVYGPFFKKWNSLVEMKFSKGYIDVEHTNKRLVGLSNIQKTKIENYLGENYIKDSFKLTQRIREINYFVGHNLCPCRPGEKVGREQLKEFIDKNTILDYSLNRDIPSFNGTSKLSASFRFGTISPRESWNASLLALNNAKTIYQKKSINTWQKELCWREFYQNILFNFPRLLNGPYREKLKDFPWENNEKWINAWRLGLTGVPIVDASMRQLNQTGWMHNRCRMIVASFLVKDLICNWQIGEKLFMDILVDGDIAANNGGWQWSASSGMDTKPLRIFNPYTQTIKFDPKAEFIKKWLPELSHISKEDLITSEINNLERKIYPKAIVAHKDQQAKFRFLYKKS